MIFIGDVGLVDSYEQCLVAWQPTVEFGVKVVSTQVCVASSLEWSNLHIMDLTFHPLPYARVASMTQSPLAVGSPGCQLTWSNAVPSSQ